MARCFYYDKNKNIQINSEKELIEMFFKDNYELKNAAIFSSDEIQESTVKTLKNIPTINNFDTLDQEAVTTFITNPNPALFNSLGISSGTTGRLAPQYILEERAYSYIKHNLRKVEEDVIILPEGVTYDQKLFESIVSKTDMQSIDTSKIIYLLIDFEKILEIEQKTANFGNLIHNVIKQRVLGEPYDGIIKKFLEDTENAELVGNYPIEDWVFKINQLTDEIFKKVSKNWEVITELLIVSDPTLKDRSIKGRIDLIAVDSSGSAHIFELKISKTEYKNWDTAKDLYVDWQLALYRQLLGQHVSISNTQLYVLPVVVEELGNPHKIRFEEPKNRKAESGRGLYESGAISIAAEKLFPRKVFVDYDPERIDLLNSNLHNLLTNKKGESYKIETGLEDYSVDKVMEAAKRRYEKEKVWRKWNNFENIPGLEKGYIEGNSEEEFRAKIERYVAHVKSEVNRNVSIYKDAIISAIKSKIPIKTSSYSESDKHLSHLLTEYLRDEWEVLTDIPEAIPMGLILMRSRKNGTINVISLTVNQFYADSHIEGLNYGDLEYMKSFLFVNQLKKELFPGVGKLGQIILFNPIANENISYYRNPITKYKEFRQLMYDQKMENSLILQESDILGIQDIALYNVDSAFRNFEGSEEDVKKMSEVFAKIQDTNLNELDGEILKETLNTFNEAFPEYQTKTFDTKINFSDKKEVIYVLLQSAYISKTQLQESLVGDVSKISKFSLGFSDFGSLIKGLYAGQQNTYNKKGEKIQGVIQGLVWTTPDWIANDDLRNINRIMSTSNQHIGEWMVGESNKIHNITRRFYRSINFTELEKRTWGETQSKHKNLWLHSGNKVAVEFKTKNPYVIDTVNALSDSERDYLKRMLLYLNMWKLQIPEKDIASLDHDKLDSLRKHPKIAAALDSGEYFEMPLVRREEISKHAPLFDKNRAWKYKAEPYIHEMNDLINDQGLLKDDIKNTERERLGYREMYDAYGKQTPEFKSKMIEKNGVDSFELNLDTIAHRIAFSKIRKKIYDKQLPVISSYVWWLKLISSKQSTDISKNLEYLKDQMKLSVYDSPIIDEEFEDMTKVTTAVKKVSSLAMLALKPATFAKEMTIGIAKGASLAATQIYGKDRFTLSDLGKAYQKLVTIDKKFSTEFNMIDQLNNFYRFANMDINMSPRKLQSDRWGLARGLGPYLYATSTLADYPNRLALFMAIMIHDGNYEAHSLVDGELKYDPRKDGRFSYYFEQRSKHLKDGKYIPAVNDKKYNYQRQLYLLLQSQLNQEYDYQGKHLTESDLVEKAYSSVERNSIKSFIDMSYGYYDKDAQSQSHNTWWGIIYLQFMQFWPGKMKMWFAKPTDESPMGKYQQAFIEDKETGEKKLLWRESFEEENGELGWNPTTKDTGDPVLEWKGSPYEGLFYSLMGTLRDILTLDFKNIKKEEDRNRRAVFALADGMLMFLMFSIIKALFDSILAEDGDEGFTGYTLNAMSSITNKVLNEYNVLENTLGAIDTEPKFVSWGRKFANDSWDVMTGDKEVMDMVTRNFGAAEILKW